jgi:mRNA-degrading endonuclease RelE of RelBE toxin-antitoxin system
MKYRLLYAPDFAKDLDSIPANDRDGVRRRLEWLADNAEEIQHVTLKEPRFQGVCRLRFRVWRIFYRMNRENKTIYVFSVKHRKLCYK